MRDSAQRLFREERAHRLQHDHIRAAHGIHVELDPFALLGPVHGLALDAGPERAVLVGRVPDGECAVLIAAVAANDPIATLSLLLGVELTGALFDQPLRCAR